MKNRNHNFNSFENENRNWEFLINVGITNDVLNSIQRKFNIYDRLTQNFE